MACHFFGLIVATEDIGILDRALYSEALDGHDRFK
jgi:hypothetical protein